MVIAVIPAYNEATRIDAVVRDALKFVDRVIVADDGSDDGTAEIAAKAGAHVVRHAENCGPGAATMTGIEAARRMGAAIIVTLDADEQHDPKDIPAMIEPLKSGDVDVVFANRFAPFDSAHGRGGNTIPFIRRVFNTIGNIVTLFATGMWVSDSQCGYKAFGAKAAHELKLKTSGFEFCTEIVREAAAHHWRIRQVPVKVIYSEYTLAKGQSFANGMRTAFKILLRSFLR